MKNARRKKQKSPTFSGPGIFLDSYFTVFSLFRQLETIYYLIKSKSIINKFIRAARAYYHPSGRTSYQSCDYLSHIAFYKDTPDSRHLVNSNFPAANKRVPGMQLVLFAVIEVRLR